VNGGAVAIADTLSRSGGGSDIEKTANPDTNPPGIYTAFFAFCDHRLDHISRLEAKVNAPLFGAGSWEAVLINPAYLARLMPPRRLHLERRMIWADGEGILSKDRRFFA